ncbi:hypothetical protein [Bracoviriform inaniti]|uniref:Uncharacterized protein n=1 Tax=Bracoviriform inaniti TaxID=36344 RepID=Q8UZC4_9VIRU|nr:hypothetical protein [Bracoviriform inaniti]CAC85453.2 hypothetical protein [Bracoviriform inaniti]
MDSKHRYAFVAIFDGKKVKKYIKTLEEIVGIEWITETKFWFRDENDAYYEGIVLAKEENEQMLQDRVSKKSLRIPHNAFKPFPDPLDPEKFAESEKKSSVKTMDDGEENGLTIPCDLKEYKGNHPHSIEESELRKENDLMNATIKQSIENDQKPNVQTTGIGMSSEESGEDDESSCSSNNAMPFVRNGRKILPFADPEKKMLKRTLVIYPKKSTTMPKGTTNETE